MLNAAEQNACALATAPVLIILFAERCVRKRANRFFSFWTLTIAGWRPAVLWPRSAIQFLPLLFFCC